MGFKMKGFGGYHGKGSSFRKQTAAPLKKEKQDMSLEARLNRNREDARIAGEQYAARKKAESDWRKSIVQYDHLNPYGSTGSHRIRLTNSLIDAMKRESMQTRRTSPRQIEFLRQVLAGAKPGQFISWPSEPGGRNSWGGRRGASLSTQTGEEKEYWVDEDINKFLDGLANYAQRDSRDSEINLKTIKKPRRHHFEVPMDDSLPEREPTGPRLNEIPAKPLDVEDITRIEMPEGYTGYTNEIPSSVIDTGDDEFEVDMEDVVVSPRMQEERDAKTEKQRLVDKLKNAKMHSDERRDIYDQLNWKYDDTIAASNLSDRREKRLPGAYPGSKHAEGAREAGRKFVKKPKTKKKKDKDGNIISRAIDKIGGLGTGAGWDPLAKVTEFLGGK